jgi:hypothetical protein
MQKTYNLYYNLGYWFLALIVLVAVGFYSTYIAVILEPKASILHIHFVLMSLWIAMLITQPFLIKYKKLALHRMLGKISYVLVPLVLISAFLMIRHGYYFFLNDLKGKVAKGLSQLSNEQMLQQAAAAIAIAFYYFGLFALFYVLAIINRRRSAIHARYMLATALTLLGPTVDRIVFFNVKLPSFVTYEVPTLILIDLILVLLLIKDYRDKRPTRTLWTCLFIYTIGQVLYFTVPGTNVWQQFVTLVMKPVP